MRIKDTFEEVNINPGGFLFTNNIEDLSFLPGGLNYYPPYSNFLLIEWIDNAEKRILLEIENENR